MATKPKEEDMRERVIAVVRAVWGNDYKAMEEETSVSAAKWKRMCNRLQQPTIEMVEALGRVRPYFIVWMTIGRAETYLQMSPHDKWQDKLARAVGINVDKNHP